MLYKGYIVGASFCRGDSLHYENRIKNQIPLNVPINKDELYYNFTNSFCSTLFGKLKLGTPRIFQGEQTFIDNIIDLEKFILNNFNKEYLKTKLVLIQLSNPQRDFIFNKQCYKLDFESENGLLNSIETVLKNKSEDFKKEFYDAVMLFFKNMDEWEKNNLEAYLDIINSLIFNLNKKRIIVKVYSYYSNDFVIEELNKNFGSNFLKIKYNGFEFNNVHDFVEKYKLRISDLIPELIDDHPIKLGHDLIAESFYKDIKNDIY